ncbi:MAG: hypothetical protein HKP24_07525, partial [Croceitalea sp.]|nr:hypothetical protein [Croceitalea sp.]
IVDNLETVTTLAASGSNLVYVDEDGSTTTLDVANLETLTSISQSTTTGVITYTDEDAATTNVNVVSADTGNQIVVGADGGAFMNAPSIYALGKVAGNGTAAAIYGATVSRSSEGDYDITFSTALSNANYIIQLTILDCGGDCPGNTGANYDDPGITYYGQSTTGFSVNIGDSDNGTTAKDDIDLEFMFTVMVLPN